MSIDRRACALALFVPICCKTANTADELRPLHTDGHKRTMVEHTLHILILPGLHSYTQPGPADSSVVPVSESTMSLLLPDASSAPPLRYGHPELSFWPPSPFHLKLPIITRLSFNEAGKITHHRDFWDVKVCSQHSYGPRYRETLKR